MLFVTHLPLQLVRFGDVCVTFTLGEYPAGSYLGLVRSLAGPRRHLLVVVPVV